MSGGSRRATRRHAARGAAARGARRGGTRRAARRHAARGAALTELLGRHSVLVERPAEGGLVEVHLGQAAGRGGRARGAEHHGRGLGRGGELRQQRGRDREAVAAGQRKHLARRAEARAHDDGRVRVALVVVVDLRDANHARVLGGREVLAAGLLVPVEDAADEGRDERGARVGAGHGLREAEEQRHVRAHALLLERLGRADALPGRGELDEHALLADALLRVERDDAARARQRARRVEAEARVDLGRDVARHELQDLAAEVHGELVED